MKTHRWVSLRIAARLLGISRQKVAVAADAGRLGPCFIHRGVKTVSTKAIEIAGGLVLTEAAVEAAAFPLPEVPFDAVAHTPHDPRPIY
jgi:hypothetical protein